MQTRYKRFILLHIVFSVSLLAFSAGKPTKMDSSKTTLSKIQLSDEEQRKFDYYFYEAVNARTIEKYDAYFDFMNYCMQIDSTNSTLLYEFGNFYNSMDQKGKALAFYKKAKQYENDNYYYNAALGSLLLEQQEYKEAIDIYEFLIQKDPSRLDMYLYLSESYRLSADIPNAIATLDRLETVVGLNERISLQKFQLYSLLDDKKKAYAEFQKYIDKYPNEVGYYVLLGNLYLRDNKLPDAHLILSKAKSIDPEDPSLITAMANYYEKTNNKEAAEKELHAALFSPKMDIDSKLGILTQYITTLQQNEGDTQRANALMDTLMIENPQEPKLNLVYGNLLMLQKKNEEAQFQFQVFAESNPTNPFGWEQMLKSIPNDSINRSIEICKMAISYIPEQPLFYFYWAVGEYQKEDYRQALDALLKGAAVISEDDSPILASEMYGLMGGIYFDMEKGDSAFIAYDKALEYNPQNIMVMNNYSYHLSLEKRDLDRAEKMSGITVKAEPTNPTFLDTYGWIMFEQGDYVTAKIYLENAVKYSEEKEDEVSAEVLEHYGDVLFKIGEEDKAMEYWQRAKDKGDSTSKTLEEKLKTKSYISEL